MRSYSKKHPLVKAHEGAAQLCRVLLDPSKLFMRADGVWPMRGGLALAPLTIALLLASDIEADQHPPFTVGAAPHLELVTVAARANTEGIQVVQVIIDHAGHIAAVPPHPLVVFRLHVDRNVLDVVLQGRPADSRH